MPSLEKRRRTARTPSSGAVSGCGATGVRSFEKKAETEQLAKKWRKKMKVRSADSPVVEGGAGQGPGDVRGRCLHRKRRRRTARTPSSGAVSGCGTTGVSSFEKKAETEQLAKK